MELAKICNALGNETRFKIVEALKNKTIGTCCGKIEYFEEGISVADVVTATGLAQSTVSQHLSVLEQAGIIIREKRSQWTVFFLNKKLLHDFCESLRETLAEESACSDEKCCKP
ncbi:MAG: Helix-turn-helix domain protein [Firmicutes bacterium ADurb.Bin182]|nr:MAG: Helix-turn-helix domain protein [Firmicutes bacterium ADurb.Bin182]